MEANGSLKIRYYSVAFIDVLGQRESLRKWLILPGPSEGETTFRENLRRSVGVLLDLRKNLASFFDSYLKVPPAIPLESLTPEQREGYARFKELNLRFQRFSDTIIAYCPVARENGSLSVRPVLSLFWACAAAMITTLPQRIPLRAAIEIGPATELAPGDIYGPAPMLAYDLERKCAEYPRVLVGDGVRTYLNHIINSPDNTRLAEVDRTLAHTCLGMISRDVDGLHYLDYLGGGFRQLMSKSGVDEATIKKAIQFAAESHQRFCEEENPKLALRYARLVQYLSTRYQDWTNAADNPQSE